MEKEISKGLCQCGCGLSTTIPKRNNISTNRIKGHPIRFINGHNASLRKGQDSPNWKGGRVINSNGYVKFLLPNHPRADNSGYVLEQILIAEKALGKPLPNGAIVHHANGSRNSGPLVICQDRSYHRLLHQRIRALKTCGHISWRVCKYCKQYDRLESLIIRSVYAYHQQCKLKYDRQWRENKRSVM